MEFKFIKSLLIGFALSCGLSTYAQQITSKIEVTSNGTTVSAIIDHKYDLSIQLPHENAEVDLSEFTITAAANQPEIQIPETTRTFHTGLPSGKIKLSEVIPSLFDFKGANLLYTVKDNNGSASFEHKVDPINSENKILGKTTSIDDLINVAQKLDSHFHKNNIANGDTKAVIMPGTHIIMGGECIEFENTAPLTIGEGDGTVLGTIDAIKNAATLYTVPESEIDGNIIKVYLPAGSSVYIMGRNGTLDDAATLTIDLTKASNELSDPDEGKILSQLKNAPNLSKAEALKVLIKAFDYIIDILGEPVLGGYNVPITLDFTEGPISSHKVTPAPLKVYKGNSTAETVASLEAFKAIQTSYPNAIAIADDDYADIISTAVENNGLYNVIVEYPVGKNGKYYECEKLILSDPAEKPGEDCSFYSPVDFYAVEGNYTRTISLKNNTCAVPFALSKSDFDDNVDVLTLAYIEPAYINGEYNKNEAWVYFNSKNEINAGVPCFIYNRNQTADQPNATILSKEFNNTYIVGEPDNSGNIHGFYTTTTLANPEKYLGPAGDDKTLGYYPNNANVYPFRSAIYYSYDSEYNDGNNHHSNSSLAKSFDVFIINEDGEITSLDGIVVDTPTMKDKIYTIDGRQINNITKSGFYIINGKKMFVK